MLSWMRAFKEISIIFIERGAMKVDESHIMSYLKRAKMRSIT